MPVNGVYLTADCYSVCLAHALTTEKEEIMGLLIGEVQFNKSAFWELVEFAGRICGADLYEGENAGRIRNK